MTAFPARNQEPLSIVQHRERMRGVAESKLRLALADHMRRDLTNVITIERLFEWVDAFNAPVPPVPANERRPVEKV